MFFLSSLQSQSISLYTFVKFASTSLQGRIPSSGHANTLSFFPPCRRPCWRLVPCKTFVLRQGTPTRSVFSRLAGAFVGALQPAKPLTSVRARQHSQYFPALPVPLLAPCPSQDLCPSSGHANTLSFFPPCRRLCWRPVPRKAFVLRQGTPTRSVFSRLAGALVAIISEKKVKNEKGGASHRLFPWSG